MPTRTVSEIKDEVQSLLDRAAFILHDESFKLKQAIEDDRARLRVATAMRIYSQFIVNVSEKLEADL